MRALLITSVIAASLMRQCNAAMKEADAEPKLNELPQRRSLIDEHEHVGIQSDRRVLYSSKSSKSSSKSSKSSSTSKSSKSVLVYNKPYNYHSETASSSKSGKSSEKQTYSSKASNTSKSGKSSVYEQQYHSKSGKSSSKSSKSIDKQSNYSSSEISKSTQTSSSDKTAYSTKASKSSRHSKSSKAKSKASKAILKGSHSSNRPGYPTTTILTSKKKTTTSFPTQSPVYDVDFDEFSFVPTFLPTETPTLSPTVSHVPTISYVPTTETMTPTFSGKSAKGSSDGFNDCTRIDKIRCCRRRPTTTFNAAQLCRRLGCDVERCPSVPRVLMEAEDLDYYYDIEE